MSRNRIIYAGVLAVALLVLFWDKFFASESLSNPQPSEAAIPATQMSQQPPGPSPTRPETAAQEAPPIPEAPSQPGGFLSAVMGKFGPAAISRNTPGAYRDLFSTPSAAQLTPALTPEQVVESTQQDILLGMELTGTLVLRGSSTASINGKTYSEGDYIGPYRLKEVGQSYAILATEDFQTTLFIDP